MILNGTTYPNDLPIEACRIFEDFRLASWSGFTTRILSRPYAIPRLKITYDTTDTESGYVSRSTGTTKIALLPHNRRSLGHHGLMRGIVRIEYANKKDGGVLWERRQ